MFEIISFSVIELIINGILTISVKMLWTQAILIIASTP